MTGSFLDGTAIKEMLFKVPEKLSFQTCFLTAKRLKILERFKVPSIVSALDYLLDDLPKFAAKSNFDL